MAIKFLISVTALFIALKASAGDYEDGVSAITRKDYTTALSKFLVAAEQGLANAQYNLGLMYERGEGVAQDYKEAMRWYRVAARQGFAQAQNNLGLMYANGRGVEQDYNEAARWYRLAAQQGEADA